MSSICFINTNPQAWRAYDAGMKLKPEYSGEELMKICYGSLDDDPDCACDMEMFMRKSVYDKLMDGTYVVSAESKWQRRLIITTKTGEPVAPIGGHCY